MWFLTLITFILILGVIVFIHELGHFLWAKHYGVFIYEFSIGMGPIIYSHRGKDNIKYNIRAFPIGGYVSMAGEEMEDDKSIPKDRFLCNKNPWKRFVVMFAGIFHNFILAIVIFFFMALVWGATSLDAKVASVKEGYPMAEAGIKKDDVIVKINGHKVSTWDEAQLVLAYKNESRIYNFDIKHIDGTVETYTISPLKEIAEDGTENYYFGVNINQDKSTGFVSSLKYAFCKFITIVKTMWLTISGLITGKIALNAVSGPVGIYNVVGMSVNKGIYDVLYLLAYLSINVGVINLLPFPAFDGGRILFIIIEKIKGSKVNQKLENTLHTIGFVLLMLLMVIITIHDIINLF